MYQIVQMKNKDIPCVLEIWHTQFTKYCGYGAFPDFWIGGKETIESYLIQQVANGNAVVARAGEIIVGYMAWMYVDFHKERTAFCPTVGHATLVDNKEKIYLALYTASSPKWVQHGRSNHQWMTFNDDTELRNMLYDLGFGSYVMDACQKTDSNLFQVTCPYRITKAVSDDVDALLEFANETNKYFSDAPIFLKREEYSREYIAEIINQEHAFIAWDNGDMIGVMSFSVNQGYHFERLTSVESSRISQAYVKPEYRRKGVGTGLLKEVFNSCLKM